MKTPILILLLLVLTVFAVSGSYAATLTVTKTADTNDGVCDADCSLREAVLAAASGDTVVFSELFNSPQTISLAHDQMSIDKNLTIAGPSQNFLTISGNNSSRIFYVTGTAITVNVSGVTFRNGNGSAEGRGGAIWVDGSTLVVSRSTFIDNTVVTTMIMTGLGAAIYGSKPSVLTLSDLSVSGNASGLTGVGAIAGYSVDIRDSTVRQNFGGGLYATNLRVTRCSVSGHSALAVRGHHLEITDSAIFKNTAGGVSDEDARSTMTIERCLISWNTGPLIGGGIRSYGLTVIKDSEISENMAVQFGGGISNDGILYLNNSVVFGNGRPNNGGGGIGSAGTLYVTNSTISGNFTIDPTCICGGLGGGIFVLNGTANITHSTIVDNWSTLTGGGLKVYTQAAISNSIVAMNHSFSSPATDVSGIVSSNGNNLIGNADGSSGWISGDLLDADPMLGPLGNNGGSTFTHALLPGSPAINAANNSLAVDPLTMLPLTHDQRGRERIVGGTVDIGAFEASYSSVPVTVSGRISTYSGRSIERTRIMVDDGKGNVVFTQTNPFGYYRLYNLIPGTTYTITVTNKLYLFTSPQFFTADQDRDDLNFITGL